MQEMHATVSIENSVKNYSKTVTRHTHLLKLTQQVQPLITNFNRLLNMVRHTKCVH